MQAEQRLEKRSIRGAIRRHGLKLRKVQGWNNMSTMSSDHAGAVSRGDKFSDVDLRRAGVVPPCIPSALEIGKDLLYLKPLWSGRGLALKSNGDFTVPRFASSYGSCQRVRATP